MVTKEVPHLLDEQFQVALDVQPTAMLMVNRRGDIVKANSQAERLFGRSRAHLIGKRIRVLLRPAPKKQHRGFPLGDDRSQSHSVHTAGEFRVRRENGVEIPVDIVVHSLGTSLGLHKFYTIIDITDRKRSEAVLRESEARFRIMADTAPVMIWGSDSSKLCTFFNKVWLDFTGRTLEQELGDGWTQGVHPQDLPQCLHTYTSAFDARKCFRMEYRLKRADGEYRWLLDNGVPLFTPDGVFVGYVGSCVDITDSKRTQQGEFSRQKLESLGVATARVAHDFGNLLSGILGHAELMLDDLAPGSLPARSVAAIFNLASRGSEIVKELIVYTGQDNSELELIDVSRLIQEMQELLKISISKRAVLKIVLAANTSLVLASGAHIRQIVMNLVVNASEAIGEQPGTIEINTSEAELKAADDLETLLHGPCVSLVVSDTGAGMTDEVQARLFDPFFTTKPHGRGLGLAVTEGIVRRYGGRVIVTSAPGRGSRFNILLPAARQSSRKNRSATTGI